MSRKKQWQHVSALVLVTSLFCSVGARAHESPRRRQAEERASIAKLLRAWGGAIPFVRVILQPTETWEKNGGSLDPWGQPNQAQPSPPAVTPSIAPPGGGR